MMEECRIYNTLKAANDRLIYLENRLKTSQDENAELFKIIEAYAKSNNEYFQDYVELEKTVEKIREILEALK